MQKPLTYRHILIIADIEGSSGCGSYRASSFLTKPWAIACAAMSRDVDAVVKGLFDAGVQRVTVKDFHRTGYNLIPEMIDGRARIVCGYHQGPVPGLGDPGEADAVMMIGMHAAAGTGGFLAHTLTSRLALPDCSRQPPGRGGTVSPLHWRRMSSRWCSFPAARWPAPRPVNA